MHTTSSRAFALAALVSCAAACGREETPSKPGARTPAAEAAAVPLSKVATVADRPAPAVEKISDRSRLFGFLPKHTIAALRVPRVGALKQALQSSGMLQAFLGPSVHELDGPALAGAISGMLARAGVRDRAVQSLVEEIGYVEGEVVLGCIVEPPTGPNAIARGPREFVELALFIEVGARESQVRAKIGPVVERMGAALGETTLEILVKNGALGVLAGGPELPKGTLARWMSAERGASFLASRVAQAAPKVPDGARETRFEALVDLAAAAPWMANVPPDGRAFLAANGLDRIQGVSYVLGATETGGFAESLAMHGGEGANLVTRLLAANALEKAFARFTPGDADSASLVSFDFGRALADVRGLLTPGDRAGLDTELAGLRKKSGIDLRADVLDVIGPSFLVATRGAILDPHRRGVGDLDVVVACELRDPERVRAMIDRVLQQTPLGSMRTREKFAGGDLSVFELPAFDEADDRPAMRPAFAISDKCLLVATSPEVLRKALDAPRGEASAVATSLRKAIASAPAGTFAVSVNDGASERRRIDAIAGAVSERTGIAIKTGRARGADAAPIADTVMTGRCEGGSVYFASTSDVYPALTVGSLAPLAIISSAAIPKLIAARSNANEAAARATLRWIASVEKVFQSANEIDEDHDGIGEYGYLAEMAGRVPLRGTKKALDPPDLDWRGTMGTGCFIKSGYCFRVDLVGTHGEPLPEADEGGARGPVPADAGESGFVAYAWPLKANSGAHAFVIDESGQLWETDNLGSRQGYCGMEREPRGDAAYLTEGSNRGVGSGTVRLGRDGALWRRVAK